MAGNALDTILKSLVDFDIAIMPTIAGHGSSPFAAADELIAIKARRSGEIRSTGDSTPRKRTLRSNSAAEDCSIASIPSPKLCSPTKWKSPRRCINGSPNGPSKVFLQGTELESKSRELLVKKLSESFIDKPKWNPRGKFNLNLQQMSVVKEALHVSSMPSMVVCRENEQKTVLEFCKQCIEQEKAGSLYVCGCPGTGKSLSMERVNESLLDWAKGAGFQPPDVLAINCTSLTNTSEIFSKILGKNQLRKKTNSATSALQHLQSLYSQKQQSTGMKMTLIIADELDYLITKDRAVLHDLFMLTTFPFSRCILIGIANAIDLADRFLPRLQSLNCRFITCFSQLTLFAIILIWSVCPFLMLGKPMVVTFRAYSKDQIILILQQRLMKVAAASGDMRKALCICRNAIEMLEAELRDSACNLDLSSAGNGYSDQRKTPVQGLIMQETDIVRVNHMAVALSKTYRSPILGTIQSLPQHQQIILCSAVKLFCRGKKDTTIGELSKSYLDICKSILIPPVGIMELSNMCRVLGDQGLLKLGQSREDKLRRVTLKVDEADIAFALQVECRIIFLTVRISPHNSPVVDGVKCIRLKKREEFAATTVVVDDSLRRLAREFLDLDPSGAEAKAFTGFHHFLILFILLGFIFN
ncbi:hypothetical protein HYC85_023857 [Camellia sinensis]|uniref:Cdc6 C-terminal domain-containing protein n=1 Tax=Camellia sinensis TaxID=4442 RepID=A0A7J7GJN6_CAMSI|nr:hypothetical protein HYC85_023857 [Camellia sinensis]